MENIAPNFFEYKTLLCNIEELANYKIFIDEKEKKLDIPAFQRGLVWNAAQVEILWDSVLRGIPLGCLTLVRYKDNVDMLGVFDGQQRLNALSLGFSNPFQKGSQDSKSTRSILWLDLLPDKKQSPSRKHFLYLTTEGQPWGYKIHDTNTEAGLERLNTNERRKALEAARKEDSLFCKPSPLEMWPYMATCPIPFAILWKIQAANASDFKRNLLVCVQSDFYKQYPWVSLNLSEKINEVSEDVNWEELFSAIKTAKETKIVTVISPIEFEKESGANIENEHSSDIAVFFSRLNRGGSLPSLEELNYSILKSILPSVSRFDENDGNRYSKGRMQPARFATIAMRLFITEQNNEWKGSFERQDAYALVSKLEKNEALNKFIDDLPERIDNLERILLYNKKSNPKGLPRYLLSKAVSQKPDLYLFFLSISQHLSNLDNDEKCFLISVFVLLCIFGDNVSFSEIYHEITKSEACLNECIKCWLYNEISRNQIQIPPPPSTYKKIVDAVKKSESENENMLERAWNPPLYRGSLNRIWGWHAETSRFFLLYTLREYIEEQFKGYDPASAVWNEDNCPWDYDHIFPQNLLRSGRGYKKGKFYGIASEFVNCIGNIAPLPFSINRQKGDSVPYEKGEYFQNHDTLLMTQLDSQFQHSIKNIFSDKTAIEDSEEKSFCVGEYVATRLSKLYSACYESLKWSKLTDFKNLKNQRNEMFEFFLGKFSVAHHGEQAHVWAITHEGTQEPIGEHDWDWARTWLACGIPVDTKHTRALVCVCSDGKVLEWGLRRHPEDSNIEGNSNAWWLPNPHETDTWKKVYCRTENISMVDLCKVWDDVESLIKNAQNL